MFNFSSIIKHKLFKNTFIYSIPDILSKLTGFFLLPVMTRYLSPTDYGIVATYGVVLSAVTVFIGLNMHGAVNVNYFKLNKEEFRDYIGNTFIILFCSFILVFILVNFLKTPISVLTKIPENWMTIIVLVAFFSVISAINSVLWRAEQRALPYSLFQISRSTLNIILSLIFVILFSWGWKGRLFGGVITSIFFGLLSVFLIYKRKYINFNINKKYIKDALFFGIPLIPASLGGWVITGIDRIFINSMVGVASTGLYSVGYSIGMIIGLVATSFNFAWAPFLFEKLNENKYSVKVKIVKFTYFYYIFITVLALSLSFIAPYFLKIFVGKNFYSAYKYVLWIAMGYAFNGMRYMIVNYIYYVKKTYISAWVPFFCAGVNIVLNYILIKANGAIGAAQATTITYFIYFIAQWIISARVYKMPWNLWKIKC